VRKLPLPIDVKPYELTGVIGGDNYLTHYKATNDNNEDFVITEFFPAYMVKREDDGTLGVSERFSKEFLADREEFVRRAEGFQEIRDASLHPVVEIFERNQTAYLVRRACGMTTVEQYLGGAVMDFDEAFYFVRPLLLGMAQVADKGMLFNINMADFRVNSFKQLVLCAPPSWDNNFHPSLTKIAKLYYKLVTGAEPPDQNPPSFSAYGIQVPTRIEAMMMEILGGDILYGSLDDFYKKFKSLLDGSSDTDKNAGKKTLAVMRGVVAFLFVTFLFSLILLVWGGVRAYQHRFYWANPEIFAEEENLPPPQYDFSDIVLTHPRNPADALGGSFASHEGFLFFRGEEGMISRKFADTVFIPGATGMTALSEDRVIVEGALPSYIVGHNRDIYFINAASGGFIYKSNITGDDFERFTNFPALNLAVIGDYLFYTNVDENHHLYRVNLNTNVHEVIFSYPVNSVLSQNGYLFFIAHEPNSDSLLIWDTSEDTVLRVANNARGSLRIFGDILFFINNDGQIQSVTFDGRHVATHSPENVRTYDVFFQWIFFAEEGRLVPRAYNMNRDTFYTLSNTEWVSYIWTFEDEIYGIDHRNPRLIHRFEMP
jgi:hypothetical protein